MSVPLLYQKKEITQEEILLNIEEILLNTGEILSDKKSNGEERPWVQHKKSNLQILELYQLLKNNGDNILSDTRLQSLSECAKLLLFAIYENNIKRLIRANFCRIRTCPICCWRKSLKLFGQTSKIVDRILEDKLSIRFLFVTFTVKNPEAKNLVETIDQMNKAFKKLTDKSKKKNAFKQSLLGYMKAIEITYNNKDDTYHPHIHALFAVKSSYFSGSYINHEEWRKLWADCLDIDYLPMVNVKAVSSNSKAISEVAKYPIKPTDLLKVKDKEIAAKALAVLTRTMHDRRLVTFGGIFKTMKAELNLDDIENGDLIKADENQRSLGNAVYSILFKYRVKAGAYIC